MNLVTGATGHIGNVLVKELTQRGESVRVLILPGEDLTPINDVNVEIVYGDILDPECLVEAFKDIDTVFHLAGLISIVEGEDLTVRAVNVEGTRNMIHAAIATVRQRQMNAWHAHVYDVQPAH